MKNNAQQEVDDELQFHIEQRTRDYMARGMSPEAAREAATQRFGDSARVRDACTSALIAQHAFERRRTFVKVSWLDVKLGLRMFAKYPGLSLVAVVGMAVGVAFGAGYFALVSTFAFAPLPFDDGDRVVMIRNQFIPGPDAPQTGFGDPRAFDFVQWKGGVTSIAQLSAFRDDKRNLITADGQVQLVRVADITASGLRLTRVRPLLGRSLVDDDERPGAPPVVVLAHHEWQRRFNGDPGVLGRIVRLGNTAHTIVGVMPEGFAFPIFHDAWAPLRIAELEASPGAGPALTVFGRIPSGGSLTQARTELSGVGDRVAVAFPHSHAAVRPHVAPFTEAFVGIDTPAMQLGLRSVQFGAAILLLVIAVNVAILVYARTATRFGEIAVRSALGATRGRVVMQLFVEALVLSLAAAALGLTLLFFALRMLRDHLNNWPDRPDSLPYWVQPGVSPEVVIYVAGLAVVAAVLVGVLPALKATGTRVQARLQQFSARGAGMQLGRLWTALIIVQVAFAVAILPGTIHKAYGLLQLGTVTPAAAAASLVKGWVSSPRGSGDTVAPEFGERMTTLIRRVEEEPNVAAATFAEALPGTESSAMVETEAPSTFMPSRANRVAANLFDVLDVPVLAGRGFTPADALPDPRTVIVDQAFADRLAPGADIVGRRIRFAVPDGVTTPNPWMEIVGVVPAFSSSFTPSTAPGPPPPSLYMAAAPGQSHPVTLIVQVRRGDPARYGQRLQEVAASVDPMLEIEAIAGLGELWDREQRGMGMIASIVGAVNLCVLLLSAAGIHAMMSFTVARRWREIGIRVALGADARRVITGIFGRATAQIGAGIAAGLSLAGLLEWTIPGGNVGSNAVVMFATVAALMFTVGLLAAAGPARRGLAVEPTEALRNE